jgi:hypothetical protein
VSILIHATYEPSDSRLVIRGDLLIQWRASDDATQKIPARIDASGLRLLIRKGKPAFQTQMVENYQWDPSGQSAPTTVHPILARDLNHDGLPEVIVAGFNDVYWNQGNWKFERKKLCDYPVKHPNAGVMADFDGDGIDDFVVGGKNDHVSFLKGAQGGQFPHPGKPVKSTERLRVPVSATAGDIDGDGDLDLFVGQQKPSYSNGDIPTPYYDATDGFPSYVPIPITTPPTMTTILLPCQDRFAFHATENTFLRTELMTWRS